MVQGENVRDNALVGHPDSTAQKPVYFPPLTTAVAAALLIIHTELAFVLRSLFWEETGITGGIGPAAAAIMITAAIAIPIAILNTLTPRFIRSKPIRSFTLIVAPNIVIAATASTYFVLGEERLYRPLAQFTFLWMLILLATRFAKRRTNLSSATLSRLSAFAIATGMVTTYAIANAWFAYPEHRSTILKFAGPAAVACSLAWYLFVWTTTSRRRNAARIRTIITIATFAIAAFGPAITMKAKPSLPASTRPNLLLITCDTLRADYTSVYGGQIPTPAMQQIADGGSMFQDAYSLAPWTVPSMFGMFSSTYPPSLKPGDGFEEWLKQVTFYRVPPDEIPLAERLVQSGFTTAAYVGNPLLGEGSGMLRGFQTAHAWPTHVPRIKGPLANAPGLSALLALVRSDTSAPPPFDSSRVLTQSAIQFLRDHADQPFFLWVHIMDPHDPYDPPTRFRTREGPWRVFGPASPHWGSPQLDDRGRIDVDKSDWDYVRSLYQGEIQYADECIDDLLRELSALSLSDRTYVCFNADHGEELWDHERFGHGHSLHDELVHVPLMFAGPGITTQLIEQPVSAIDIMPTLASLMKVDADPAWLGQDLSPLLTQSIKAARSPVIAQATNRNAWPDVLRMYRDRQWKLIDAIGRGSTALYDMDNDPKELNNLIETHPETVTEMTNALKEWEEKFAPTYSLTNDAAPETEMLEHLRSLGYVN